MGRGTYEVIVGNVGTVYVGPSKYEAHGTFKTYVELSMLDMGRASGESVVLMYRGDIIREHQGQYSETE